MSIENKSSFFRVGRWFGAAWSHVWFVPFAAASHGGSITEAIDNTVSTAASPALEGEAGRGHNLFAHNCAHCHADDARGDEGRAFTT